MGIYAVKYFDDGFIKSIYIKNDSPNKAKKEFLEKYPNLKEGDIIEINEMKFYSKDYGMAVFYTKFIAFLGWLIVIAGLILSLYGLTALNNNMFNFIPFIVGLSLLPGGFIVIVVAQSMRAVIENANFTREILEEIKQYKALRD